MKHKRQQIIFTVIACALWVIGIVAGGLSIRYGKDVLDIAKYYGSGVSYTIGFNESTQFGTDYYTLMYKTNAAAANSAYATYQIVKMGLGNLLIVLGIALLALSAYQIFKNIYKLIVPQNVIIQSSATINSEMQSNKNNEDFQNELLILKNLFEAGAITEQEYEIKKKETLGL